MHRQCRFLPLTLMLCTEIHKLPSSSWTVCEENAALVLFFLLVPIFLGEWCNSISSETGKPIAQCPWIFPLLLQPQCGERSLDVCHQSRLKVIFPAPVQTLTQISGQRRLQKKRRDDLSCDPFSCPLPPGCLVLLQSCTLVFWAERWWTGAAWVRERNGLTRPRTRESRVRHDSAGQEKESVNSLWIAEKWGVWLHTDYTPGSDIKTWALCVWRQLSLDMTPLFVLPDCLFKGPLWNIYWDLWA